MTQTTLHLRSETKAFEHRSALTPSTTKALLDAGFHVNVERSPERIFKDDEFAAVGAKLVDEGSWPSAPADHLIIGLKELPEEDSEKQSTSSKPSREFSADQPVPAPLVHTHIQFAHCYKNQANWTEVLSRFPAGGGTLLDLEFLADESGRRVAAFGYHAGYAGAALALLAWAWQLQHGSSKPLPGVDYFPSERALVEVVRTAVDAGRALTLRDPRILIIGALGRCGRGAVDLCLVAGIPSSSLLRWDLAETAKGGPFAEIVESDIFVNCIYLSAPIPPFISPAALDAPSRQLSVVCDVSCDTTNPHNPIPIYDVCTTFEAPTVPVPVTRDPVLSVISIDHLPSLLPREASEAFSSALLPSLLQLNQRHEAPVWKQAEGLFQEKVALLPPRPS